MADVNDRIQPAAVEPDRFLENDLKPPSLEFHLSGMKPNHILLELLLKMELDLKKKLKLLLLH